MKRVGKFMVAIVLLCIIGAIIVIKIWAYIAQQFADIAEEKGFSDRNCFWIPFLFGIVGWIMVAALPDRGKQTIEVQKPQNETEKSEKPNDPIFKDDSKFKWETSIKF